MNRPAIHLFSAMISLGCFACAGEVVVDDASAPAAETAGCTATLCVDDAGAASLAGAKAELSGCVPTDDLAGDAAGLRISELAVAGSEGELWTIRVVLANVSSGGVMTYPGSALRVDAGAGEVLDPMAGQLYGIFGCSETEALFTVKWDGASPLGLVAAAFDDLGETTEDEIAFALQPGG